MNRMIILLLTLSAGVLMAVSDLEAHVIQKGDLAVCSFERVADQESYVDATKVVKHDVTLIDFHLVKFSTSKAGTPIPADEVLVADTTNELNAGRSPPSKSVTYGIDTELKLIKAMRIDEKRLIALHFIRTVDLPLPES